MTLEQVEKEEIDIADDNGKGGNEQNMEKVQKQIDGRIKKFFMENVLMEQPFCLRMIINLRLKS